MKLIKLPINLGIKVKEILEEKNIEPRKYETGPFKGCLSLEFTQEELDLITELNIENPTSNFFEGIEHLRMLEKLSITTAYAQAYKNSQSSINDKDIKRISQLKKLKSLSIDGQPKITWLLLDNFLELEELIITRNINLEEIVGLDRLFKLKTFEERGNKNLFIINNIESVIKNNNLDCFELDLLHYKEIINERKKLSNIINCSFSEQINKDKNSKIEYTFYQVLLFHNKCLEIANLAKSVSNNIRTQILFVEKYLAENITYDNDSLKRDDRTHYDNGQRKGKSNGTNSAYNGIMFGSAVCEGYTRSMQYILKLMGIKSKNVYCIAGKDKIKIDKSYHDIITLPSDGYHSIIRIDFDDAIYYFDPCWDSCRWHNNDQTLPYSFLTKKEISQTHTLSFEEDDVIYDISYPRLYIKNDLEYINSLSNQNKHTR